LLWVLQVDVFSFGVVLWEIWTLGDQPYPNLSLQEIFAGVMTGTLRPAVPPGCDPEWVQLMQVRVPGVASSAQSKPHSAGSRVRWLSLLTNQLGRQGSHAAEFPSIFQY
jgi:hypothetical protein